MPWKIVTVSFTDDEAKALLDALDGVAIGPDGVDWIGFLTGRAKLREEFDYVTSTDEKPA